jgi:pilus assembly protein CpaB
VLAAGQRIDSKNEEGKTVVKTFATVTLEATPRIAEKIAAAQSMGTLSLALRSIADNTAELERAVAAGDVKVPAGTNPTEERRMLLAVANRPADNNTTYVTGGDVSRFQRRSVPRSASSGEQGGDAMTKLPATAMGRAITGKDQRPPRAAGSGVPRRSRGPRQLCHCRSVGAR